MTLSPLVLGVMLALSAAPPPQLLVSEDENESGCRPAPSGWDSSHPVDRAIPSMVAGDLDRYFSGHSFQATAVLKAAWHGTVYFCTEEDERRALRSLAALVVRPPSGSSAFRALLDDSEETLLRALACPVVLQELEAIEPRTDTESARRRAALEIVRQRVRPPS